MPSTGKNGGGRAPRGQGGGKGHPRGNPEADQLNKIFQALSVSLGELGRSRFAEGDDSTSAREEFLALLARTTPVTHEEKIVYELFRMIGQDRWLAEFLNRRRRGPFALLAGGRAVARVLQIEDRVSITSDAHGNYTLGEPNVSGPEHPSRGQIVVSRDASRNRPRGRRDDNSSCGSADGERGGRKGPKKKREPSSGEIDQAGLLRVWEKINAQSASAADAGDERSGFCEVGAGEAAAAGSPPLASGDFRNEVAGDSALGEAAAPASTATLSPATSLRTSEPEKEPGDGRSRDSCIFDAGDFVTVTAAGAAASPDEPVQVFASAEGLTCTPHPGMNIVWPTGAP